MRPTELNWKTTSETNKKLNSSGANLILARKDQLSKGDQINDKEYKKGTFGICAGMSGNDDIDISEYETEEKRKGFFQEYFPDISQEKCNSLFDELKNLKNYNTIQKLSSELCGFLEKFRLSSINEQGILVKEARDENDKEMLVIFKSKSRNEISISYNTLSKYIPICVYGHTHPIISIPNKYDESTPYDDVGIPSPCQFNEDNEKSGDRYNSYVVSSLVQFVIGAKYVTFLKEGKVFSVFNLVDNADYFVKNANNESSQFKDLKLISDIGEQAGIEIYYYWAKDDFKPDFYKYTLETIHEDKGTKWIIRFTFIDYKNSINKRNEIEWKTFSEPLK